MSRVLEFFAFSREPHDARALVPGVRMAFDVSGALELAEQVVYGFDVDEEGAFESSVSDASITRVIEGCAQFGMILAPK